MTAVLFSGTPEYSQLSELSSIRHYHRNQQTANLSLSDGDTLLSYSSQGFWLAVVTGSRDGCGGSLLTTTPSPLLRFDSSAGEISMCKTTFILRL